jgi:thiosulfate/3-mercaptopyruvate sulfurtransferase
MHSLLAAVPKLVTTAWLAAHLADPNLVILHVGKAEGYATHIAGAQRTDLSILAVNAGPQYDMNALLVEMLSPDVLRQRFESYGISDHSTVVVYAADDSEEAMTSATRIVYTLRVAGLGANAALLDGGLPAWKAEGRPVTTAIPRPVTGHITATPVPSLVVDAPWVVAHAHQPGIVLVDARAPKFYSGEEQGEARRGHIPGAHNIPFTTVFDDHDKVKSPVALKAMFASAGAQPGDTIVAYCHIGMEATAVLFAADQAGYPVRFYDGSFQDWADRKDLPVVDPSAK